MEELFLRVLSVSLAVSILLLPLLLCRGRLERRYAPQVRWSIWVGLSLLLLLGPLWRAPRPVVVMEAPSQTVTVPTLTRQRTAAPPRMSGTPAVPTAPDQAALPAPVPEEGATSVPAVTPVSGVQRAEKSLSLTALLARLWLGVGVLLLAAALLRYGVTRRRMLGDSLPAEIPGEEIEALGLTGKVRFRRCRGLDSPVTLGLLRPVILLPEGEVPAPVLRHELLHVKRKDIWGKTVIFLACIVHWFDPLVWLMARSAGRDVECACDAQVVSGQGREERRAYGELLLASAGGGGGLPFSTRFGGGKEQMKARLTQLFRPGKLSRSLVCVLLTAALLLTGLVACQSGEEELADGLYCSPVANVTYPVEEDPGSLRLSLLAYDEVQGPNGKPLGDHTLPLAEEVRLEWAGRAETVGETGRQEAILSFLTLLRQELLSQETYPGVTDYLVVQVTGGEIVWLSWARVSAEGPCYFNDTYGFALRLPDSWAGQYTAEEGGMVMTFYQTAARRAEDSTAGVLMDLVVTAPENFEEVYGDKDLEGMYEAGGPWIKVLFRGRDMVIYAQIDPAVFPEPAQNETEETYLTLARDAIDTLDPEDLLFPAGWESGTGEDTGEAPGLEETPLTALIRERHAEMARLTSLYMGPDMDEEGARYFTPEELKALNYGFNGADAEPEPQGYTFWPIRNAPASREALVTQLYNCFVPELADDRYSFTVLGYSAPCLFADGQMWHRITNWGGPTRYDYDWNTLEVVWETEDVIVYRLSGYANYNDPDALKTWEYALRRDDVGGGVELWRYSEIREVTPLSSPSVGDLSAAAASYEQMMNCLTIEGFDLGTPFEELPASFRSTLTKVGAEDLLEEGAGIWTTYTAPGIEIVTTQVNPDWELLEDWERDQVVGKEYLSIVRITDSAYATAAGLRVGDAVERCGELGYDRVPLSGKHYQMGLQSLTLTVEDGVITAMESCDGLRYVGSIFY